MVFSTDPSFGGNPDVGEKIGSEMLAHIASHYAWWDGQPAWRGSGRNRIRSNLEFRLLFYRWQSGSDTALCNNWHNSIFQAWRTAWRSQRGVLGKEI